MKWINKYGPWSLVTGASSGIGRAVSEQLAARGLNVILVARSKQKLLDLSNELEQQYAVDTKVIAADLIRIEDIDQLIRETRQYDIGLLVNNAGKENSGNFTDIPVKSLLDSLMLNSNGPVMLSHHFAKEMIKKQRGGIVMLSSIVAFQGVPLIANYAASKAFDLVFAEGLAAELRPHHVDVLIVAPGFTKTNLAPDYDFRGLPLKPMKPIVIAKAIVDHLGKRGIIIPGLINKFLYYSSKFFPRKLNTSAFGYVFRKVLRNKVNKSRHNIVYTT